MPCGVRSVLRALVDRRCALRRLLAQPHTASSSLSARSFHTFPMSGGGIAGGGGGGGYGEKVCPRRQPLTTQPTEQLSQSSPRLCPSRSADRVFAHPSSSSPSLLVLPCAAPGCRRTGTLATPWRTSTTGTCTTRSSKTSCCLTCTCSRTPQRQRRAATQRSTPPLLPPHPLHPPRPPLPLLRPRFPPPRQLVLWMAACRRLLPPLPVLAPPCPSSSSAAATASSATRCMRTASRASAASTTARSSSTRCRAPTNTHHSSHVKHHTTQHALHATALQR